MSYEAQLSALGPIMAAHFGVTEAECQIVQRHDDDLATPVVNTFEVRRIEPAPVATILSSTIPAYFTVEGYLDGILASNP